MKLLFQTFSPSKRPSRFTLAALFVLLTAGFAQAEPPHAQLRPFAPGGIAVDWEHPNDGARAITLERENPAFNWVFVALVSSFNDLGLEASRVYRYRVCAVYAQTRDCTPWLAAQTLATPPPYSPVKGVIYGITINDDLMWYRHVGRENGSSSWAFKEGKQVGTGWNVRHVFSGGGGVIYAVADNGDLRWYRHLGREDGSFRWVGGHTVSTGWFKHTARQVFPQ